MYNICSNCGAINKSTNTICVKCESALCDDILSSELEVSNEEFYNSYIPGEYEAYKEEVESQPLHITTKTENNPVALMPKCNENTFMR